ncbi:cyanate lyase C-terminal domain-containing protein [Collybia nuda]|uniref:Cyanate hydratase n=1 Tax=Collybia nuda TaxID=64659 RepID=A0A9P6CA36_9AGAR|nr:cyanate lyase C-terminal domain-containing protein [Collybia nuda]
MAQSSSFIPTNNGPYADLPSINSKFFEAKARKGLTFEQIAKAIGKDEVWLAAGMYGQAKFSEDELRKLAEVLEVPVAETLAGLGDHWWPNRGLGPVPPTDPVIYRLYEVRCVAAPCHNIFDLLLLKSVLVYGYPIKAVIHEKFGDGIMSMIDCKVNVDRKADPKGDRVVLTFDGKFLPYAKW